MRRPSYLWLLLVVPASLLAWAGVARLARCEPPPGPATPPGSPGSATPGTPVPPSPLPPVPPPAIPPAPPVAATPPPAGPHPKIEFDHRDHDFGVVKQQGEYKAEFAVRNAGDAPLHVSGVRGDCGCTLAEIADKEILAGGTSKVTVTFRTYTFLGPLTKHIHVTSDDPVSPQSELTVRLDVSGGILLEPPNFFFNAVLVGSSPTATVRAKWKDGVGKPFELLGVDATGTTPTGLEFLFDSKRFDAPPWHGYEITMRFPKPPPVGMVTGTALIRTDDKDLPRVQCLIGGNVSGRVQVALLRPNFGIVPQGKGGLLSIKVRPFDATIDLGEVTAKARKGKIEAKAVADEKTKGEWTVEIRLPESAPEGPIDDVVDVTTSVKGEEKVELPIGGSVSPKSS